MNEFLGNWKLLQSENWDEYMKAIGVGLILRKIGEKLTTYCEIKRDGDYWVMSLTSAVKNQHLRFRLGEEIDEVTPDGRHMKSTFTMDGSRLVQRQRATNCRDVDSVITREVTDDQLITTCEAVSKEVKCRRVNVRYQP